MCVCICSPTLNFLGFSTFVVSFSALPSSPSVFTYVLSYRCMPEQCHASFHYCCPWMRKFIPQMVRSWWMSRRPSYSYPTASCHPRLGTSVILRESFSTKATSQDPDIFFSRLESTSFALFYSVVLNYFLLFVFSRVFQPCSISDTSIM